MRSAQILQAESGDIVMVDVSPGADLTPGSVFLTQVPPAAAHCSMLQPLAAHRHVPASKT